MTAALRAPSIALIATAPFWLLAMYQAASDPSYPATHAILFSLPFFVGALVVALLAEALILTKAVGGDKPNAI